MEKVFDDQTQAVTIKMMCLKSVTIFLHLPTHWVKLDSLKLPLSLHKNFPDIAFGL